MTGERLGNGSWPSNSSTKGVPVMCGRACATFLTILCVLSLSYLPLRSTAVASEALAEIDGVTITTDEVEKALGAPLAKLQEQIYTMKRQKVEALIGDRLMAREAAKRGMSVGRLLDSEVTAK